jgi:hypothetical protein
MMNLHLKPAPPMAFSNPRAPGHGRFCAGILLLFYS